MIVLSNGVNYKFASSKKDFEELDAFIRMRLRRYLSRNKDSKNRQENLLLTNEVLKNMGLKSLTDIYMKYASKKRFNSKKNKKKHNKNGLNNLTNLNLDYGKNIDKSLLLAIFKELKEITKNINYLKKRIGKIEKKVVVKILFK